MVIKRISKIFLWLIVGLFSLFGVSALYVSRPSTQAAIIKFFTASLGKQLNTEISIKNVEIDLFQKLILNDFLIRDLKKDTLLFAHQLKLNASDFLFFKERITVNYIGLNNVQLNLHKHINDSIFNYQFILNQFSSPSTNAKKSFTWQINLQKIVIENLLINYDHTIKESIHINLASAKVDVKKCNINEMFFELNNMLVDGLKVQYSEHILSNVNVEKNEQVKISSENTSIPKLIIHQFKITNSELGYVNTAATKPSINKINLYNLFVDKIDVNLQSVYLSTDSVSANLQQLSLIEKCGFQIKNLQANIIITNNQFQLKQFLLNTPYSHIQQNIALNYDSIACFNDFENKVQLATEIENSYIDPKDISYFATIPSFINKPINFKGNIAGKINSLKAKKLEINSDNIIFNGNLNLKGLPDVENTLIDFNAKRLTTNGNDLLKYLPHTANKKLLERIGNINFEGNFTGFINDFVANGFLNTSLGKISADVNVKINKENNIRYNGKIKAEQFQLGTWLNESELGIVNANLKLEGTGWINTKPEIKLDGLIDAFEYHNYRYTNVEITGLAKDNSFEGKIKSLDPNFNIVVDGLLSIKDSMPKLAAKVNINHIDLNVIHLSKENDILTNGQITVNASGKTIDDFFGNINATEFAFSHNGKKANLKQFICSSKNLVTGKELIISSDLFKANVSGLFNYQYLPISLQKFGHQILPSYVTNNELPIYAPNQNFSFGLSVFKKSPLLELLLPQIKSIDSCNIDGAFNLQTNNLQLTGNIPYIDVEGVAISNSKIESYTQNGKLKTTLNCETIKITDSINVHQLKVNTIAFDDSLIFTINLAGDTSTQLIELKGLTQFSKDAIQTNLLSTPIYINKERWVINPNNSIVIAENKIEINNLSVENFNQKIIINSFENGQTKDNISIVTSNLKLNDIETAITHQLSTNTGIINGVVEIKNIFATPIIESNIMINELIMLHDTIGNISAMVKYATDEAIVNANVKLTRFGDDLDIQGYYNLLDSLNALNFKAKLNKFNIHNIEPLIADILSNKQGYISGNVSINGPVDYPKIYGSLLLKNGATTVKYTNARYTLDDIVVNIVNNNLYFEKSKIYDVYKNQADFTGSIKLKNFKGVELDLNFDTKNLLVLNTNIVNNELFYGKAYANGKIWLKGKTYNLTIGANAKTNKGTQLFIPITDDRDLKQHSFINFVSNKNTNVIIPKYIADLDGVTLDFDIDANEDAEMNLLMDLTAGDYIRTKGTGKIKIDYSSFSTFNMFGNYEISRGEYYFTLLNAVNKNFIISKGSNIVWNGSPYNANLIVTAYYPTSASFYELVKDELIDNAQIVAAKKRVPVNVKMLLAGELKTPKITFDIETPSTSNSNSFLAIQKLQRIRQIPDELNNQVYSLLVSNQFIPVQNDITGDNQFSNTYKATLSELASVQVSKQLNDAYKRLTKDDKTEIGLNYRWYDANALSRNYSEFNFNVSRRFLADRLTIFAGGIFDNGRSTSSASNLGGDFLIEYNLTPDGRAKIKGYNKTEYDILNERNRNRTGIGLAYRKEFYGLKDLFLKPKKKN
jgi:hypothetical protein